MDEKIKVLLVEDEVLLAMGMEIQLTKAGLHVVEKTATGEAAIEAAKEKNPSVILMDIRLAGEIDGFQAVEEIRKFCDIPIIFVTGYSNERVMDKIKRMNPLGYCTKPVNINLLISLIDQIKK